MTGEVAKTFGFLLGNRLARFWLVMDELSMRREARSFAALSRHAIAPRAALPRALANGVGRSKCGILSPLVPIRECPKLLRSRRKSLETNPEMGFTN